MVATSGGPLSKWLIFSSCIRSALVTRSPVCMSSSHDSIKNVSTNQVAVDSFLESVPRKSAIALAFVPQLVESADELGAVLGVDAILNGHENRSAIVINLLRDRWGPPMERGG